MDPLEKLKEIADQLKAGGQPPGIPVRELLSWFGARRRGYYIVQWIKEALSDAGLITKPDFEGAWIDGEISFALVENKEIKLEAVAAFGGAGTLIAHAEDIQSDPTNRIGKLAAANRVPTSVTPNDTLITAITIMMRNDFSYLPVMTNERDVKGVVGWQSIGSRLAAGKECAEARDCMERPAIVTLDTSFFEAMNSILSNGYVLVRDETGKISGIVTTYDLSFQFRELTEPFLLLGEIENHIRTIVQKGKFNEEQLKQASDPADRERDIVQTSDLTWGGYIRLLENPENWKQVGLKIDRKEFVCGLNEVREIRNDIMHFEPDPLSSESLEMLRNFVQFLRRLPDLA